MRKVRRDLSRALGLLGLEPSELSLLFVGSARMKSLNSAYRCSENDTDVLSFPMDGEFMPNSSGHAYNPIRILGDIVISVPRTVEQAEEFGVPFQEELLRLLIHGLLHLIGYDHETSMAEKRRMEKKERELFNAITVMD